MKKRNKRFIYIIGLILALCFVVLMSYWSIKEAEIWLYGERIEIPIENMGKNSDDDYFFSFEFKGLSFQRSGISKKAYEKIKDQSSLNVIWLSKYPDEIIFLDLNDKNQLLRLIIGLCVGIILLIGIIGKVRSNRYV